MDFRFGAPLKVALYSSYLKKQTELGLELILNYFLHHKLTYSFFSLT